VQQPSSAQASIGEAPYYLSCMSCRWDSKSIGLTFEKPTGLASQLQKLEDASQHHQEYDAIRDHVEPYLRAGLAFVAASSPSTSTSTTPAARLHASSSSKRGGPTSAIAAAARALNSSSSTVLRDIPSSISSASKFNSLHNLAMRASGSSSNLSKYGTGGSGGNAPPVRDTLKPYASAVATAKGKEKATSPLEYEKQRLEHIRGKDHLEDIPRAPSSCAGSTTAGQLWSIPWQPALDEQDLRPLRIPLKCKKTKRCHACRHIVVKPDTKASSTKYKIRLVASSYLPYIEVQRRMPPSIAGRLSAAAAQGAAVTGSSAGSSRRPSAKTVPPTRSSALGSLIEVGSAEDVEPLRPGRNYTFHLTFVNPLWERIEVFLNAAEPEGGEVQDEDEGTKNQKARDDIGLEAHHASSGPAAGEEKAEEGSNTTTESRQTQRPKRSYQVTLPATKFAIDAFVEDWEYEGLDDDGNDDLLGQGGLPESRIVAEGSEGASGGASRRKRQPPGILAKKGNKTVVQLDLATARDAAGTLRIPLNVTFTYTADDATSLPSTKGPPSAIEATATADTRTNDTSNSSSSVKSFSFWTSVLLGTVVPRPTAAQPPVASRSSAPPLPRQARDE